eukprot:TRINITY_DN28394_c0_g1_i1.p1 TRINITY_DN28394_c0_g1~~TRINITY_DN28394_c0_g1_i1.p1  ORF type:complete len:274 (-),score=24.30 TRINITY_DN28394_c0_g1_i1:68-838(-)
MERVEAADRVFTLAVPISPSTRSSFQHILYIKQHRAKPEEVSTELPPDQTVFVIGLPPYFSETNLRKLFSCCGDVAAVRCSQHGGTRCAHVVFTHRQSVKKCFKADTFPLRELFESESFWQDSLELGMKKWQSEHSHQYTDAPTLQRQVDAFMQAFDRKVEEERKEKERNLNKPDEDGFITVTRHKRSTDGTVSVGGVRKGEPPTKKQKGNTMLSDFYKFQHSKSKDESLALLRRKFEEDRDRIQRMKNARKFRPG